MRGDSPTAREHKYLSEIFANASDLTSGSATGSKKRDRKHFESVCDDGDQKRQSGDLGGALDAYKAAATAVGRTADYLVAARDVQAGKAKLNAAAKASEPAAVMMVLTLALASEGTSSVRQKHPVQMGKETSPLSNSIHTPLPTSGSMMKPTCGPA